MADGGDVGAAGYEAALDGLEALRAVLRDEHSLLTQYKMIVWGRVFTPVQVRTPSACCLRRRCTPAELLTVCKEFTPAR